MCLYGRPSVSKMVKNLYFFRDTRGRCPLRPPVPEVTRAREIPVIFYPPLALVNIVCCGHSRVKKGIGKIAHLGKSYLGPRLHLSHQIENWYCIEGGFPHFCR